MSDEKPLGVEEALRIEAQAIRPGTGDAASPCALCISGGGIRSATFALGAIQGLAEHGLLGQFHYLSTVSGGGYIGSWLTAWVNRAKGIDRVVPALRSDAPPPLPGAPDPIRHLRDYNSYLSPRRGALSADFWTLIATILRNILLNWMVLIPLLMAALMLPRLYLSALAFPERLYGSVIFATASPDYSAQVLSAISGSPLVRYVLPLLSGALLAAALFNTLRYLPGVGGRDHSRYDYVVGVLAPLVGAVLTFLMFDSLYFLGTDYVEHTNIASVVSWTFLPCLAALASYLLFNRQPLGERMRVLLSPLSLAVVAMAVGTGSATWAATNYLLWSPDPQAAPTWAEYVTIGPPTILLGFCLEIGRAHV